MVRGFLPVLFGGVLGALLVAAVLGGDGPGDQRARATDAEQRTDASNTPERTETDDVVTADELAGIADPIARRNAALAILDAGGESADTDRIAALLAAEEGVNFRIHAIVHSGAGDPEAAISAALALPEREQRRLALDRLAPVLAAADPLGALAAIDAMDAPGLKVEFVKNLLEAWVALDPAGVFLYLESPDASAVPPTEATFQALAASDPEHLLALAEDLRRDVAKLASVAALGSLIEQDAVGALARIEALTVGSDKSRLRSTAIEAYGEQDPEAAWSWAMASDAEGFARSSVIRGIHKVDPDLAWEIMSSQWNSTDAAVQAGARESFLNYINIVVVNSKSTEDIIVGLDRILTLDGVQDTGNFMVNLQNWANSDPEAALEWSLRNLDRINASSMLTALSSGLARTNLDLARQTLIRLDEPQQASWSAGVARTLAQNDLAAARAWTFEFPSGPLRDAGLREVIHGEAQGGTVDRQLFGMFSSDAARSDAASLAARRFGCDGQTALGLELATAYITDLRLLETTQRQLEGDPDYPSLSFSCGMLR